MDERTRETQKLQFDRRLRLEFHGAKITSDTELLACRELDGALGSTEVAPTYLRETRGGCSFLSWPTTWGTSCGWLCRM